MATTIETLKSQFNQAKQDFEELKAARQIAWGTQDRRLINAAQEAFDIGFRDYQLIRKKYQARLNAQKKKIKP